MNYFLKKGLMFSSLLAIALALTPSQGQAMEKMEIGQEGLFPSNKKRKRDLDSNEQYSNKKEKVVRLDPTLKLDVNLLNMIFSYLPFEDVARSGLVSKNWHEVTNAVVWNPICNSLDLNIDSPLSSKQKVFSVFSLRSTNFIIRRAPFSPLAIDRLVELDYEAAQEKKAASLFRPYSDDLNFLNKENKTWERYNLTMNPGKYKPQLDEAWELLNNLIERENTWAVNTIGMDKGFLFGYKKLNSASSLSFSVPLESLAKNKNAAAITYIYDLFSSLSLKHLRQEDQDLICSLKENFEKLVKEDDLKAIRIIQKAFEFGTLGYSQDMEKSENYKKKGNEIFESMIAEGDPASIEKKIGILHRNNEDYREYVNKLLREGNPGAITIRLTLNIIKEYKEKKDPSEKADSSPLLNTYVQHLFNL